MKEPKEIIASLTEEELLAILKKPDDYLGEWVNLAKEETGRRGIAFHLEETPVTVPAFHGNRFYDLFKEILDAYKFFLFPAFILIVFFSLFLLIVGGFNGFLGLLLSSRIPGLWDFMENISNPYSIVSGVFSALVTSFVCVLAYFLYKERISALHPDYSLKNYVFKTSQDYFIVFILSFIITGVCYAVLTKLAEFLQTDPMEMSYGRYLHPESNEGMKGLARFLLLETRSLMNYLIPSLVIGMTLNGWKKFSFLSAEKFSWPSYIAFLYLAPLLLNTFIDIFKSKGMELVNGGGLSNEFGLLANFSFLFILTVFTMPLTVAIFAGPFINNTDINIEIHQTESPAELGET